MSPPATGRVATPSRDDIALLPPFPVLPIERIRVPVTEDEFAAAAVALAKADVLGFDTESKPTFQKGEVSEGPHVVQFATDDEAWVFQVHRPGCAAAVAALLEAPRPLKAGFGLASDRQFLKARLDLQLRGILDLNDVFRREGHRGTVGVRSAVAMLFGQRFAKSKKQTTSDWSAHRLNEGQLIYAANDAWAALQVLRALGQRAAPWPVD